MAALQSAIKALLAGWPKQSDPLRLANISRYLSSGHVPISGASSMSLGLHTKNSLSFFQGPWPLPHFCLSVVCVPSILPIELQFSKGKISFYAKVKNILLSKGVILPSLRPLSDLFLLNQG